MVGKVQVGMVDKEDKAEGKPVVVEGSVLPLMLLRILCQSALHR